MVSETGLDLTALAGKTLSSDFGNITIDSWGKLTVNISSSGTYAIDTSTLILNSNMKITGA